MKITDQQIMDIMVHLNLLPKEGGFDVSSDMIDAFVQIYQEATKSGGKLNTSNLRYARKLAGLSLMKLNLTRGHKTTAGILYLISNPAFLGCYKIGITQNLDKRLAGYQTYDPYRQYKVEQYRFVSDIRKAEKIILDKYKVDIVKGEWVKTEAIKNAFGETL